MSARKPLQALLTAVFWVGLWQVLAMAVGQVILIPSPLTVLQTLWRLVFTTTFWQSVGITLLRISIGFVGALFIGSVFALLTARFSLIRTLLSPLLHIVRAAPVASFIIITLVWISYDFVPIFISFLMVLPMVWLNVEQGIREMDPQQKEMACAFSVPFYKRLTKLYLPSIKPFFLTAAVNGLGFAWKSGVAAEVICRPDLSIGRQLQDAKVYMETPDVFAWTAVVILLSLLLEHLLLRLTRTKKEGIARADS